MNRLTVRRIVMISMLATIALAFSGCGSKMDGTSYSGEDGAITVDFKSGKAYVTMMGTTTGGDYEVSGDQIIIHSGSNNLVLTKNSDGTLSGPMDSKLTKK